MSTEHVAADEVTLSWDHVEGAVGYKLYTSVPRFRHLRRPTVLPDGETHHPLGSITVEGLENNREYRFHPPFIERLDGEHRERGPE